METEPVRGTILAVDDEPDILVALEDLLEDEYRVLTTSRPAEALDILAAEPDVAVIVSDQRMPGLTGDALLARRGRSPTPRRSCSPAMPTCRRWSRR